MIDPITKEQIDFSWRNDPKRFSHYYELQQFRVKNILVISSSYDDFTITEDSSYSDMLFESYSGVFYITPPKISRVSNVNDAIEALKKKQYDLVITMSRLYGINPFELGQKIKKIKPDIPVILLLTSITDILSIPQNVKGVDDVFLYNGDSSIFMTIVKVIEDRVNVENDTTIGNTRVIILVEDSIQYYSVFLPLLYQEMVSQTRTLLKEGVNSNHRRLLIRGRPKILLATSFEQAIEYYQKYSKYILGVISDIAYPKNGVKDWNAGFELVNYIREYNPYMPFCLQSTNKSNAEKAEELGTTFIYKMALDLLKSITVFLQKSLGFGEFVFNNKIGKEFAKVHNFEEFINKIPNVPDESIEYHAQRNHFSNWLYCRSEFKLANILKTYRPENFETIEDLKYFLRDFIDQANKTRSKAMITEFNEDVFDEGVRFSKFGGDGSLGGKGRGLAFSGTIFGLEKIDEKFDNLSINIPETIVITTQWFDEFIDHINLDKILDPKMSDEETKKIFLSKSLPKELQKFISLLIKKIDYPIAVRSSSLLEDSQHHPLAGVYNSYMVPNSVNKKEKERVNDLATAIKLVYASTFSHQSKSFIKTIGQNLEIEKMAVIIQRIVGKTYGERYYPTFSGVARSYNYYAISPVRPDDGVAYLAVGHGEIITLGEKVLTYSPKYPKILPTHSNPKQSLSSSQTEFFALNLNEDFDVSKEDTANLTKYHLEVARKEDKTLKWLASVYDGQNDVIKDGISHIGPLVIRFPFLLKFNRIPINEVIIELLKKGKEAMGTEVELEFAVNIDYENEKNHEFYLLQIRPMVVDTVPLDQELEKYSEKAVIYSEMVLGNGVYKNITDFVVVDPEKFNNMYTYDIQSEIAEYNQELKDENYFLIGFGRWGTSDRFLGIPVKWHEINNASAIAELELENYQVDPSSGQHFFLNMISSKKAYFTILWNDTNSFFNWEWLKSQKVEDRKEYTIHYKLDEPLYILIDGKASKGIVINASDYLNSES